MPKVRKRLGEILIDSKVITPEILQVALELQRKTGEKLGTVLVNNGYTSNDKIIEAVKNQLGIQEIKLNELNIRQDIIDIVPENLSRKYSILPVDIINGQLFLAMADPLNYFAIEDIKLLTGYAIIPGITYEKIIIENIEKYYGKNRAEEAAMNYSKSYTIRDNILQAEEDDAAPVIRFINTIIENSVLNNASDIHIEPQESSMIVRIRVDGFLRELMKTDYRMISPVISRIKIMANLNIAENRVPQDGRIEFRTKSKNIDLRVSIVPTMWGEKVVMRILDKSSFNLTMEKLGLMKPEQDMINNIISKPHGIILVAGPTGSGKTTTLYSILNSLNDIKKNIITIEDPVEYNMKGIYQMQVNAKINFTFASGLRSILRQDPDIILVGEIRDEETAEISVRSALTGHLVLSSIHTNSAVGSIVRLVDMNIKPFLISSTLVGVISQRLVRKICQNCKEEYEASSHEKSILGINNDIKLYRGKGCPLCNNSGYKGRVGVFEILTIDKEIKELIDNNQSENTIEKKAIEKGMISLKDSCTEKVIAGITTIEEMLRVTYAN